MDEQAWEETLRTEREQKDQYFRESPDSPLPDTERHQFTGLSYYPPDPTYRLTVSLVGFEERDEITVDTNREGERTYLRWGQFRFKLQDQQYTLTAFKSSADDDRFWVPFKDETNDDTTYPAGRYLDLQSEDTTEDGDYILDFNRAYSPFCAHADSYECPVVPFENRLAVRIEAGEKYQS